MKCKDCSLLDKTKQREALGCYQYGCRAGGWTKEWIPLGSLPNGIGCEVGEKNTYKQMSVYDFPELLP